jgi:hypothetical protein
MLRIPAIAAALLTLAACATSTELDPGTALDGKELDTAVAIYGYWQESRVISGKQSYIWRRELVEADARYYCELTIETSFRRIISRSHMQGFPRACLLFSVRYEPEKK